MHRRWATLDKRIDDETSHAEDIKELRKHAARCLCANKRPVFQPDAVLDEMEAQNITHFGLAKMIGVELSLLDRWLSGEEDVPSRGMADIAEALDIPGALIFW